MKCTIATVMTTAVLSVAVTPNFVHASQTNPNPVVILQTSMGDIHIELFRDRAPRTVQRFMRLVDNGFYNETLFHRVVRDYVIQAGLLDMQGEVRGEELEPLDNEADNRVPNRRGTVAMARFDDPQSAKAEFFINVRDNHELNFKSYSRGEYGFAVFGQVIEGMDVVDEISELETRRAGILREFPRQPVAIYEAYVLRR